MDSEIFKYYLYSGILGFLFLLVYFKFKKKDKPISQLKFWSIWILFSIITGTVVFIISIMFFINTGFSDNYSVQSFDSESWILEPSKRVDMIDDFMETKRIDGMTKKRSREVIRKTIG